MNKHLENYLDREIRPILRLLYNHNKNNLFVYFLENQKERNKKGKIPEFSLIFKLFKETASLFHPIKIQVLKVFN